MKKLLRYAKRHRRAFILSAFILLKAGITFSQAPLPEYQIKAVFLYNFTQFVEWPSSAFQDMHEPFIIGVLGDDPFGSYLDETIAGEKINDHPLKVIRFDEIVDVKKCHILFVAKNTKENLKNILKALADKNVLTVGESSGFTKEGGMIMFTNKSNKIKLHINLKAAKAADLVISSKLLRLAEVVIKE